MRGATQTEKAQKNKKVQQQQQQQMSAKVYEKRAKT